MLTSALSEAEAPTDDFKTKGEGSAGQGTSTARDQGEPYLEFISIELQNGYSFVTLNWQCHNIFERGHTAEPFPN